MKNQRKNERFHCLVPVEGKRGSPFECTKTVDFSKGGFGLISSQKIPVNKEIAIQIDLSQKSEPALVVGRVKWVSRALDSGNYRIGISFEDVLKGSKTRLDDYFREKKIPVEAVV